MASARSTEQRLFECVSAPREAFRRANAVGSRRGGSYPASAVWRLDKPLAAQRSSDLDRRPCVGARLLFGRRVGSICAPFLPNAGNRSSLASRPKIPAVSSARSRSKTRHEGDATWLARDAESARGHARVGRHIFTRRAHIRWRCTPSSRSARVFGRHSGLLMELGFDEPMRVDILPSARERCEVLRERSSTTHIDSIALAAWVGADGRVNRRSCARARRYRDPLSPPRSRGRRERRRFSVRARPGRSSLAWTWLLRVRTLPRIRGCSFRRARLTADFHLPGAAMGFGARAGISLDLGGAIAVEGSLGGAITQWIGEASDPRNRLGASGGLRVALCFGDHRTREIGISAVALARIVRVACPVRVASVVRERRARRRHASPRSIPPADVPEGREGLIDGKLVVERTPATLILREGDYHLRIQATDAARSNTRSTSSRANRASSTCASQRRPNLSRSSDVEGADVPHQRISSR